jgi:fermentation-respiration switch protein FrsA (DUF1100 family)
MGGMNRKTAPFDPLVVSDRPENHVFFTKKAEKNRLDCDTMKEVGDNMQTEQIIYIVVGAVFLFYMFISYLVYRDVFVTDKWTDAGLVDQSQPFFAPSWEWYTKVPKETVSIRSYDNVKLSAVYIPSFDEKSVNTAIVCHGYQAINSDMAVIAKMYSDLGFRVLMPDARGHGLSKGGFTSLGHYERYDLKRWIQYLLRTYGATDQLLLHGVSMGAATVLLTSAMDLPGNVKMVVADSPYTSGYSVIARSMKPKILSIFLPGASLITFFLHRFFVSQANVLKAVKKSKIPLFIYHGEKDVLCPLPMAKRLLAASAAVYKDLYPIPGAGHAEGFILDKEGIEAHVTELIRIYFQLPKSTLPKKTK